MHLQKVWSTSAKDDMDCNSFLIVDFLQGAGPFYHTGWLKDRMHFMVTKLSNDLLGRIHHKTGKHFVLP